jgi:hypothetical protein
VTTPATLVIDDKLYVAAQSHMNEIVLGNDLLAFLLRKWLHPSDWWDWVGKPSGGDQVRLTVALAALSGEPLVLEGTLFVAADTSFDAILIGGDYLADRIRRWQGMSDAESADLPLEVGKARVTVEMLHAAKPDKTKQV